LKVKSYLCSCRKTLYHYIFNIGGACIENWFNYSGSCYLFPAGLGDPWSMLTWSDAKQKCATVLQGTSAQGATAHLLYIETPAEKVGQHDAEIVIQGMGMMTEN